MLNSEIVDKVTSPYIVTTVIPSVSMEVHDLMSQSVIESLAIIGAIAFIVYFLMSLTSSYLIRYFYEREVCN